MTAVYQFTIPNWLPPRANEYRGRHWSREHRAKKRTAALLAAYALAQGVPRATGKRRVSLMLTLGPGHLQPDSDCYDKAFLDACVRCGLLLDDSARGLDGRMAVTFRRGPATESVIELTDC